jgi:pyruvate dehydrogenase (quinone)
VNTVADFIWERLATWGVNWIYGYPGDGFTGMTMALRLAGDKVEVIQVRHEESAAVGPRARGSTAAHSAGRRLLPGGRPRQPVQDVASEDVFLGHCRDPLTFST